ncbi:SIR2 family protein [Bradyrhizobium arachidis]|uniref:SIR2 family protein n=1 Tax=Bradyrhizobium arachidis TaxID=858423 RepID=UPI0021629089|nr:SIR2 family protein [Bradyrhizobium arachidis]UVO28337.1 SIR2 family protein [Bradyrhizobium arachidis]
MKPHLQRFVDDYLAELIEGNAAVFAGAGLSVPAGFVDWRALLRPLSKDLDLDIDLETDLVAVAQFHVNANAQNRHKLNKALLDALSKDVKPTANHRLLVQLPITTFWTTNYDKLIENSLHEAGRVVDVKSSVPQMSTTRPHRDVTVYKMHGDIERPNEAIITKDNYEEYPKKRAPFITALAGDLVKRTFLFLGFSFTDPNLDHVLTQVRYYFSIDQRQHFAIFRTRSRMTGESDEHFAHHLARQKHVIEDLKRFNIKVLLVDEYSEITEVLTALVNRYRRRTVFIGASAFNFDPWGQAAVSEFAEELGRALIADGTRIATGLGAGIGDAVFTGALREIMRTKLKIDDTLVLRPFPQTGDASSLPALWDEYRREILSQAGIALFLFGNKESAGKPINSDGLQREFEIAREEGLPVLPVGATGSAASALAQQALADPDKHLPEYDTDGRARLEALSKHTDDLKSLVAPIVELVRKLQGKG